MKFTEEQLKKYYERCKKHIEVINKYGIMINEEINEIDKNYSKEDLEAFNKIYYAKINFENALTEIITMYAITFVFISCFIFKYFVSTIQKLDIIFVLIGLLILTPSATYTLINRIKFKKMSEKVKKELNT